MNADGLIDLVTNPANESYEFDHEEPNGLGLLTEWADPELNVPRMSTVRSADSNVRSVGRHAKNPRVAHARALHMTARIGVSRHVRRTSARDP